jgi:hypothetical protein
MPLYRLIAENRNTGKETPIGQPDTHERILKFKWAHTGCNGETYNFYKIREINNVK